MEEIIKSVARNQLQLHLRMPFGKRSRHGGQMQSGKTHRRGYLECTDGAVTAHRYCTLGLIYCLKNIETVLKEMMSIRSEIYLSGCAV